MKLIGIPRALLYWKYHVFIEEFIRNLGGEYIISPGTTKDILNEGVKYCVDDACLPIKVFHGHVNWLKDKCDLIIVPRIMQLYKREYICPKFCGLPEMIKNSIPNLSEITEEPIYATTKELYKWCENFGLKLVQDRRKIKLAFDVSLARQKEYLTGYNDDKFPSKIGLLGHPYSIHDKFCNMNIVNKLHELGVGVVTEEYIDDRSISEEVNKLFKKPFWTFARLSYGAASVMCEEGAVDGLIYVSSFACGIDSVVIELIKNRIGDFPLLVLKLDEHSGEAGLETRIEAYADMLERRINHENKLSQSRKHIFCS